MSGPHASRVCWRLHVLPWRRMDGQSASSCGLVPHRRHLRSTRRGRRGDASEPGTQRLVLAFDTTQTLRTLYLEIEEREVSRTQDLHIATSCDGGTPIRNCFGSSLPSAHLWR